MLKLAERLQRKRIFRDHAGRDPVVAALFCAVVASGVSVDKLGICCAKHSPDPRAD